MAPALLAALIALAQEPTHSMAATQPSVGHFFFKTRLTHDDWDAPGADGSAWTLQQTVLAGLPGRIALGLEISATDREIGDVAGLEDLRAFGTWRFLQRDLGPVDTQRAALIAGAILPTGDEELTRDATVPVVGAVLTDIRGRRGFNFAATWEFHSEPMPDPLYAGEADAGHLRVDGAWVWRIAPVAFGPDYRAAQYFQFETRWDYETNGDSELRMAPGWLMEAPRFALEASLELPVAASLDARPERDWSVILGVRVLL